MGNLSLDEMAKILTWTKCYTEVQQEEIEAEVDNTKSDPKRRSFQESEVPSPYNVQWNDDDHS